MLSLLEPSIDRVHPDRDDGLDELFARERAAEGEPLQHPVVEFEQHRGEVGGVPARRAPRRPARSASMTSATTGTNDSRSLSQSSRTVELVARASYIAR